jgi:hypothetical protein
MLDSSNLSGKTVSSNQIRLQLVVGFIGVPLSVASAFLWAFAFSFPSYGEYWAMYYLFSQFANITGLTGTVFTVVGSIGILQRNRSNLAWVFVVVYILGWIWHYAYSFVIFPGLMTIEEIDPILVISVIANIYGYSLVLASLYAWWSIHTVVVNRPVYFTFLLLYSIEGVVSYLVTSLLSGFGVHTIHSPEEAFALRVPSLIVTSIVYLVLFLFYISQLYDSRKDRGDTISEDSIV